MALVALGGYGRSELAPGSDVDLMILHGAGTDQEAEEAFASVLYPLWDLGVAVGHAIRTPEECGLGGQESLPSLTALLDARLLAGSEELLRLAGAEITRTLKGQGSSLIDDLRASLVEREARAGTTGDSLEPDLRDGVGGLRDVALLGWVTRGVVGGDSVEALVPAGLLRSAELNAVGRAHDFLLLVRTALHRATGTRSNRLTAEAQGLVAELLQIPAEPTWEARDVLMRTVFDHGRRVQAAVEACLERAVAGLGSRQAHVIGVHWDRPAEESVPEALARLAEEGGSFATADLDRIESTVPSGAVPWTEAVRSAFVRMLASGDGGARALRLMDLSGWLGRLLPEWEAVRGRPQRDPFHRYPVDTHLVRTAAHMARLLFRPDDQLEWRSVSAVSNPEPLLVGALLHDAGKVGSGNHVPEGARVAAEATARMGLPEDERELVSFLVQEHLLLADTATRRNLEDQDLILHVAAKVGTQARLGALYLMTLADAESTGPASTTPWRLGLIRELVSKVSRTFERGEMSPDRAVELERAERSVLAALRPVSGAEAADFLARVPPAYLLWVEPEDAPVHHRLIVPRPGLHEARTHHRPGRAHGVHLLTVGALDRPGLLAHIAGALTLAGLSVMSAQAFTTEDGVALDAFEIIGAFEEEIGEERWRRFRRLLRHALEGRVDLADQIRTLREHYRPIRRDIEVKVRTKQDASDFFTVIEVGAPDRLGLLFDLGRAFVDRGLDVHLAKVATYGPRVVDVFYVTDQEGQKVEGPAADRLAMALRVAAGG
jgi:[protein-PII] uridylyltransferase